MGNQLASRFMAAALAPAVLLGAFAHRANADEETEYVVNRFEADTMALVAPASGPWWDAGATAGKSAILFTKAAVWRQSITPSASAVVLRMRGHKCGGIPIATVQIDNVTLSEIAVGTAWQDYRVSANLSAGSHWVTVRYNNEFKAATCDRNLLVDTVTFLSTQPVNTGTAGSTCQGTDNGLAQATAPGLDTKALGAAPAYYEVGRPLNGVSPKGVVIQVHGGGWSIVGIGATVSRRPNADWWRGQGWTSVNVDYRACAQSLPDVLWFYDRVKAVWPSLPVCIEGGSAGGQLALMVAALRPDLDSRGVRGRDARPHHLGGCNCLRRTDRRSDDGRAR